MALFFPGHWELVILAVVVLLLFFAHRIPRLARDLGRSLVEFKAGLKGRGDRGASRTKEHGDDAARR